MIGSRTEFKVANPTEKETAVVKSLFADARNRKLLSPAESINGLTVGAIQYDSAQFEPVGNRFNPFLHDLPSLVSAFGSGYRRSIKPDCVFPGGRMLYQEDLGSSRQDNYVIAPVVPSIRNTPPGNQTAIPGPGKQPESLGVAYSSGTSNATALISRAAGVCYDSLQQLFTEQAADVDTRAFDAPLLKAMLVHGCAWGDVGPKIADLLRTKENKRQISGLVSRWMGYGVPQVDRVLDCTAQRATLLGFGQLSDGKAHVFRLPLPPSLGARPEWRRLTVTLAWLSPISPGTQKYRTAGLWFEVKGISLAKDRQESCSGTGGWQTVKRGTVQHEVFEGHKAEPFSDGGAIEIKVNCREDAEKIKKPVAYGLAMSLEVAEDVDIAVYDEIRMRIVAPAPAPAAP
uniref:Subtilase family protein n=1 Tax=Candidatus Kentrum sp. LFY TaxID=2126342 RepID=A0A450UPL4_9GAMM|nr:MAG: Subtilase family protein [Candidatus Kentron sp. LFY]